jgi:hypothetical protein
MQLIVILFGLTLTSLSAEYSLADLEVLSQEGNFSEFFQHALDVRPTERKDSWNKMVLKMSERMLEEFSKKTEIKRQEFYLVEKLAKWPTLKADEFFLQKRGDFSLKYLENCLIKTPACQADLQLFWDNGPHSPDTAMKIAEITFKNKSLNLNFWTFLAPALKSNLSEFYCRKPFVLDEVWKKISLSVLQLKNDLKVLKSIDNTMHPECLKEFNPYVKTKLLSPSSPIDRETAFVILRSQGKTKSQDEDFFYFIYLLERPSQGSLFNEAWNRVKFLGKDAQQREMILSEIKKLDPLPDEIFISLDSLKRKVVLKHLKFNIPEYFDFYFQQCLAYYSGKEQFQNGNPTIHCKKILQSELATELFTPDQIKRLKSILTL